MKRDAVALGLKCAAGLICRAETCVEIGRLGDACEDDDSCASAVCTDGKCVAPGLCN